MEKERVDAMRISSRNRYARFIYICRSILEGRFRYLAKSYSRVVILLHGEASERERKKGKRGEGQQERGSGGRDGRERNIGEKRREAME